MTPVALVAYQSGLTAVATGQEAPDEVTGAAGALVGGRAGGASWCADDDGAALGWRVAELDGVLGPAAGGELGVTELLLDGWLVVGLVTLA
jgi:hypothetical protein